MERSDDTLRVMVVPCMGDPYETDLRPDESGSYLAALQSIVGGYIESMPFVFGDKPSVFCNGEGKLDPCCPPNRAIYATSEMVDEGYLSPKDRSRIVEEGELMDIAFGDLVCVGFDQRTGASRSITDAEARQVCERFGGAESILSGRREAFCIHAKKERPESRAADAARIAASETSGTERNPRGARL